LLQLEFYTPEQLTFIVERSSEVLKVKIDPDSAKEIANRSRGTPRIANRILRRVRDYAQVLGVPVSLPVTKDALAMLDIDSKGFDRVDRKLLLTIIEKYGGGPVGLRTLSANLGDEEDAIQDVSEPYLIQNGYLDKTPRGRVATKLAYEHFGIPVPKKEERTIR
jgi:Holliday junction DNA helicase RuvB